MGCVAADGNILNNSNVAIDVKKLKNIKMLVLDVDGILTDCRVFLGSDGEWKRFFSVRDGVGIKRLIESRYQVALITGSNAVDIRARVKQLGIHYLYEGSMEKVPAFKDLQKQSGFSPAEMAYMGDDFFDLPILNVVQFSATVPDAMDEVLSTVQYITKRPAGNGAVREVCDYILKYGFYSNKD